MRRLLLLTLSVLSTVSVAWAEPAAKSARQPEAVSPGGVERFSRIAERCPTFSWNPDTEAVAHQLVVYRIGTDGNESAPVLRQTVPGGAGSWTPALGHCLAGGERYGWSVRAVGTRRQGFWSSPSLFEVAAGPGRDEFEAALAVVREYLEARDADGSAIAAGEPAATSDSNSVPTGLPAPQPDPLSPPATTQLSVDGNIDATSFTGDGENLANVATDAELSSHSGDAAAHHDQTVDTTCDGQACDGTSFSNVTAVAGDNASSFFSSGTIEEARIDAAVQRRVTGSCPAGQSIRSIDALGAVTCEADDVGTGDITEITTASDSGLAGGCSSGPCTLSADPTDFLEPVQMDSGGAAVVVDTDTSTYEEIDSQAISAPVAGTVLAIATGRLDCTSCAFAGDYSVELRTGLTTNATGTPTGSVNIWSSTESAFQAATTVIAQEKFAVSAGTTTIYWRGAVTDAVSDTVEVSDRKFSLIFFPD